MIDLDVNGVVFLQPGKDPIQDTLLGPTIGARINRMPITKFPRQPSPLTAMFRDIQNGVEYL